MKNINPTKTVSWEKLTKHFQDIQQTTIKEYYKDPNRKQDFSIQFSDLLVDFSKNSINKETIQLLTSLAKEVGLKEAIETKKLNNLNFARIL